MTIFERALALINDGDTVGLGSGRASMAFIKGLGRRVKAGLKVRGVPTSVVSEELARSLDIPIVELADGMPLAVTVDGADQAAPDLSLIKGWGRALIREKVVAAASKKLIILVGTDKLVPRLGASEKLPNKLPVEVVPFALPVCRAKLIELGVNPVLWEDKGVPAKTDNGNYILDCMLPTPIDDPAAFSAKLEAIPGVVGTGLFLNMASAVLVGDENNDFEFVRELTPRGA